MKKIYFCGSIRGGRGMAETYERLIKLLQLHGEVLTEHIGEKDVIMSESESFTDEYIYKRDMSWLKDADMVVAEVSVPSLGVGYELGYAVEVKKPVLCLYNSTAEHKLSAMIKGCQDIEIVDYKDISDLDEAVREFVQKN